ncbi:MarR family transcriptional regulator [Actinobacteria bacterium YIM 96077]|uniref:MarR family transcriptional regulator n=1 Tax=Phytoactinopolyspora halophila TaxID=1981511 RepID=A0A329R054_9ACTN|nr:MarR family transcriptional regulator [Phytoactinopolyspora halophila]AYY13225.1 MarR family transcriptional regulator [Actinobacteria bacterium YIM 96077]RAW17536.1 MarR family transcriptional regulator [Phytoactinopolyspora halophila]
MDEPRWLDEREARAWRGYRQMRDLLDLQIARDLNQESGLSDADYTVLTVLSEAPGHRMRLIELARRTLWSKSRLSHQLSRMQRRGLVRREECEKHPEDSRAIDAVLTAEGLRLMDEAAPRHVESVRRNFIDLLTPEQLDALGDGAEKVIAHLRGAATND